MNPFQDFPKVQKASPANESGEGALSGAQPQIIQDPPLAITGKKTTPYGMKPRYIVAVSGGVDSVVMLHRLMMSGETRVIVAHIDHGIRPESGDDAAFVGRLAARYALPFESTRLALAPDSSEASARQKRWEFLRSVKARYQAAAILTAHHADDVVETMIINLLRGTGWRGIASLVETEEVKRPLLHMRKREVRAYAAQCRLEWREDKTNDDTRFLRNYVRRYIVPQLSGQQFSAFLKLYEAQVKLRKHIEHELALMEHSLRRYHLVMWPDDVACEVIRSGIGALPRKELRRVLLFARVARPDKTLRLSNGRVLRAGVKQLIVLEGED